MQSKYLLLDRALRNARRDVWVERDLHWAQWLHRVARYQTPVKSAGHRQPAGRRIILVRA